MQIEVALVLHVAAWQIDHLSEKGVSVGGPKLEGIEFRLQIQFMEGVADGICRRGVVEDLDNGHDNGH